MKSLPETLHLTFGQVAWALCAGQEPDPVTIDRLRYLRQLGVPFAKEGGGSGNRRTYGFDELVECAIALYALRKQYKPKPIAKMMVSERKILRSTAREKFTELPQGALDASWVKSRGKERVMLDGEVFLRVHDRFSETPGKFECIAIEDIFKSPDSMFGDEVETYANGEIRALVPLKRVMLIAVAWALEAPETRTGPK